MTVIIEAAARALQDSGDEAIRAVDAQFYAAVVIDAVTPLIEDAYARKLDAAEEIARKGNEYTKGWKLLEDDGSVTTLGTSDAIEAAERALEEWDSYLYPEMARAVLTAVSPLIRASVLEEVARMAEELAAKLDSNDAWGTAVDIATAIRALKDHP